MTNEEKYVIEKFKELKEKKRMEMIVAMVEAGYTCTEIAVAFNLPESLVRKQYERGTSEVVDEN